MAGAAEAQSNASGGPEEVAAAEETPLLLLNGHVCALSTETPKTAPNGNQLRSVFQLREPYQWESDEEAVGFLLPRWMWGVVGGEMVSKPKRPAYRTRA